VIYFIQAGGERGPVKIGYAGSVRAIHARLALFQTAHMEPLTLLSYVEGDKGVEREFHAMFARDRIRGEWFRYSDQLWGVCGCRASARDALNSFQCMERYRAWGIISAGDVLTYRGREYLISLEERVAGGGASLERFYAEHLADFNTTRIEPLGCRPDELAEAA
jgi:hypothetical protein